MTRIFVRKKGLSAIAAVCLLLILAAIVSCGGGEKKNKNAFKVYYDERKIVPYSDTIRNGTAYINAWDLAEYCGLTVTGDGKSFKIYSSENEYMYVFPSSDKVRIGEKMFDAGAPAAYESGILWIPCDLVNRRFSGVKIVVDLKKNKLSVWREEVPDGGINPAYVKIKFMTDGVSIKTGADDEIYAMIRGYEFMTDTGPYAEYLNPSDPKYLMLVNKDNALGKSFVPEPLMKIDEKYLYDRRERKLEKTACMALEAMLVEMRASGFNDIFVTSAYRDYDYQNRLFEKYIAEEKAKNPLLSDKEAREKVLEYSAAPGTSEHQSGLCVDFIISGMGALDETFASYPAYGWLRENAHKFGFILRYPKEGEKITKYCYEPWHYRFVGQYAAAHIRRDDLCLEEYIRNTGTK